MAVTASLSNNGVSKSGENQLDISLVIPVYNEVENINLLHNEISAAMNDLLYSWEVVYVNDGSRDGSVEKLELLAQDDREHVVFVDLRRNFGQTAAIAAGIDHSVGRVVALMDADLQNDPADVGKLMDKLDEGYDLVSGWRKDRQDKFLSRRLPSMLANSLISRVTGVRLHDYGCTLKAYRREVIDEVRLYGEMHRFIPVFASAAGANIAEMVVNHRARIHGKSKYGIFRTFKVILDLMTVKFFLSYRTTPMYLFGGVGAWFIVISLLALLGSIVNLFISGVQPDRTPLLLISGIFFAVGVQSFLLGLTAELLTRTYYEAQDKPTYVVRRVLRERADSEHETAQVAG